MTTVMLEPITTTAKITTLTTSVQFELVNIYSIYYWLFPGFMVAEHQEVAQ